MIGQPGKPLSQMKEPSAGLKAGTEPANDVPFIVVRFPATYSVLWTESQTGAARQVPVWKPSVAPTRNDQIGPFFKLFASNALKLPSLPYPPATLVLHPLYLPLHTLRPI